MKLTTKLWIGLGIFIFLSPLGLILPEHFKAGGAWGEWQVDEMDKLVGYVPQGMKHVSDLWRAPMNDYSFKGWGEKGWAHQRLAYVISAIVGSVLIAMVVWLLGKLLIKKKDI